MNFENKGELVFDVQYLMADINIDAIAIVFSGSNDIDVWRVMSYTNKRFIRRLPLFYGKLFSEFYKNSDSDEIVYQRTDTHLFVVLYNTSDHLDRRLFMYDIET